MTDAPDRWRRVEALCQAALERPAAERDAFLRRACSDDALRREVEMLLARESAADRFLETGVGAAAARVEAERRGARPQDWRLRDRALAGGRRDGGSVPGARRQPGSRSGH